MAVVIFAPHKDGLHDGSIQSQIMAFIKKLFQDDTLPGLHIEPIQGAIDPKVRTGRVNDMYRAVLFKVYSSQGEPHYIFTGVWPHDKAIAIAEKAVLKTNSVNGLPELVINPLVEQLAPGHSAPPTVPEAVSEAPAGAPLLESVSAGISLQRMTDELGLDPELAERALAATTEDELLALASGAVEWQGLALVELTAGGTIEQVLESLDIHGTVEVAEGESEEDRLLEALKTRAGKAQFVWLEDDDELRAVIEDGDFAAWKVFLHPEQRKYVEGLYNGSFRLSGGAGTGKTVVLLHRARFLAQRDPSARIVLTTYTRTLADAMKRDLLSLDSNLTLATSLGEPGIFVTGVDSAASAVLSSATPAALDAAVERVLGVGGNRASKRTTNEAKAWRDAVESSGVGLPDELKSPSFLIAEYDAVVLPHRITTRDEYLKVRRPGRGVALGRAQRAMVWDVINAYRTSAAVAGLVDFGEVCGISAALLDQASTAGQDRRADHVLVDEGQDLTAARWQFLRALVAEGPNDLFIAEDAQQRIYGQRITLGRYGIKIVGRARRLSLNYRTTHQVLRFAMGVLEGQDFVDLEEEETDSSTYRSARSGPQPVRRGLASLTEELDEAARIISEWLDPDLGMSPEAIGILVRDQRTSDRVTKGLEDRGIKVRQVTKGAATAKDPQVMTMHRAKGMEFSRVLIFGADAEMLPASYLLKDVAEGDRSDVLQRERSLLYVAATRARDELVVLWEGSGSAFLAGAQ
ncbi:DNA helicase [Aeromicrobium flavum]|uniref:DNA 3'-5' helicase n=1 Tax=Aeromicrobium flavum TaxID=416568 RepID=A0A512HVQ7_9ACTN|nr:3'-5' exonuclease [Aeromicrobium flavum]GEO89534.1 DNA helicase [Aeromicrobium flavum]